MPCWIINSTLKFFRLLLVLFFITLSLSLASKEIVKIRVITEIYSPYQKYDQQGQLVGCTIKIVKALFQITGAELTIEVMPWARAYATALTQPNTLLFSVYRTKKREPLFHWVGSMPTAPIYFWGLKENFPLPLTSLEQTKQFTFAVPKNYYSDTYLTKYNFPSIHRVTHQKQAIEMLFHRRVNLIVVDEAVMKEVTTLLGHDLSQLTKVLYNADFNLDLSITFGLNTESQVVKRYQDAYKILENKGIVNEIMNQCS